MVRTETDGGWPIGRIALAALMTVALAACRTVVPSKSTTADAAPPAARAAAADVPFSPTMMIVRGDETFVLLRATVEQVPSGSLSLELAYAASSEASGGGTSDATGSTARAAIVLLDTLGPLLSPDVREASVAGVFGAPGTWGVAVSTHAVRDAIGWSATQPDVANRVLVPPLPSKLARPIHGERAAVEAAREFLERADERDGEGAWELVSGTVKATMSRRSLEEVLWAKGWAPPRGGRHERFTEYDVRTGEFSPGDRLAVCFAADGEVEMVGMRLDDDQEWRVVHFARPASAAERPGPGTLSTWLAAITRATP